MIRVAGFVALFLLLAAIAVAGYTHLQLTRTVGQSAVFVIPPGDNLSNITRRLREEQLLPADEMVFKAVALFTRERGPIQAGHYRIEETMDSLGLLALFRSGRVVQYRITFPEGWVFSQWRAALQEAKYLRVVTPGMSPDQIAGQLGLAGAIEGRLFPDTYQYTAGDSDLDILSRAIARMDEKLNAAWQSRGSMTGIENPYKALILASIIEKETGDPSDRAKIASVFHNRLARGMKLQSDPTVIYGLGDRFDGDLTRAHLREDNPFNTYTRTGLPPTPICSPGLAAIDAAMAGSAHPYLYFVARGDGTSQFSETLQAHNEAVNRYQRR